MSDIKIAKTPISDLLVLKRAQFTDNRGYLSRLYCRAQLSASGLEIEISQINHTLTRTKGSIRGMHFQHPPYSEGKVVTCIRGCVYDVAIDLRAGSQTFLHWYCKELSGDTLDSLFIPKGFAHGFQTLQEECEMLYLHTEPYNPASEGGLNFADPKIGISWPLEPGNISPKDKSYTFLDNSFTGLVL